MYIHIHHDYISVHMFIYICIHTIYIYTYNLVGGLEHFLFSPIVGMMIQSDFHSFSEELKPPTSKNILRIHY